jgi:hypothetical protein
MQTIISNCLTPDDFTDLIGAYREWRLAGAYSPDAPFTLFLSEHLEADLEKKREVFLHELTHLQVFTSTAFGHAQQVLSSFLAQASSAPIPSVTLSSLQRCLSVLHEASWDVHEGVATITPYLIDNGFTQALVYHSTYASLPQRYGHAASLFAVAVGGLLPIDLASMGHVAANAVAQFCLNTSIMNVTTGFLRAMREQNGFPEVMLYAHLSEAGNHPQCRLLKLIEQLHLDSNDAIPNRIKERFIANISTFPFVECHSNGSIQLRPSSKEDFFLMEVTLSQ